MLLLHICYRRSFQNCRIPILLQLWENSNAEPWNFGKKIGYLAASVSCISESILVIIIIVQNKMLTLTFNWLCICWMCANLNQHSGVPLKIKRLARDPERFIWALSMAQSRCIGMQMRIGALVQDANMLIPYAGKLVSTYTLWLKKNSREYIIKLDE